MKMWKKTWCKIIGTVDRTTIILYIIILCKPVFCQEYEYYYEDGDSGAGAVPQSTPASSATDSLDVATSWPDQPSPAPSDPDVPLLLNTEGSDEPDPSSSEDPASGASTAASTTAADLPQELSADSATEGEIPKIGGNREVQRTSQIESTFELLDRGDREVVLKQEIKDVVLVLGNTGSGKTTFTQWLEDDSKLIAKEVEEGTEEYLIEDNDGKIGNTTINSKTIFPELVKDAAINTFYYDLPGFEDTRSLSHDIASTYFIKKVLDNVERVKIVFIVNYSSVRKGVDRLDFIKLLKHATDLVKNISTFENSIAICVTKVDPQYILRGTQVLSDDKVIKNIAKFLNEVRHSLTVTETDSDVSIKQKKFYINAVKLLDVLLLEDDEGLSRIAIFRRPDEPGPLSEITLLQEGKKHLRYIVNEKLNFSSKNCNDFGHTISESSKNDINDLVKEIQKKILSAVNKIAQNVRDYYFYVESCILSSMDIFAERPANLSVNNLTEGYTAISRLVEEIKNSSSPKELAYVINKTIIYLNNKHLSENSLTFYIDKQGYYLEFLQEVSSKTFNTTTEAQAWASEFQNILIAISDSKKQIHNKFMNESYQTEIKLKYYLSEMGEDLRKNVFNEDDIDLEQMYENAKSGSKNFREIQKTAYTLQRTQDCVDQIIKDISNLNILPVNHRPLNSFVVQGYANFYDFLNEVSGSNKTFKCAIELNNLLEHFDNSQKWYEFLLILYHRLSEYEIQKDVNKCHVLSNEVRAEEGKKVSDTGLKQFLKKCFYEEIYIGYDNIKDIILDKFMFKALDKVLNVTLKYKSTQMYCDYDGKLVVQGQYVLLRDFVESKKTCYTQTTNILIYALNTVFIDTNMQQAGENLQISIIAPTWVILGNKTISLDGTPGEDHYELKAPTTSFASGQDGQPGRPGHPGGNFFGIGEKFINNQGLIISVNGGDGGPGQHGADGRRGLDGKTPELLWDFELNAIWHLEPGRQLKKELTEHGYDVTLYETFNFLGLYTKRIWNVYGRRCTDGKNGGRGGLGGFGAKPGIISITSFSNDSSIQFSNKTGTAGPNGLGGYGGKAGNSGQYLVIKETVHTELLAVEMSFFEIIDRVNLRSCSSGLTPHDINRNKGLLPDSPRNLLSKLDVVDEYKTYVRESIQSIATKASMLEFLNKLDNN